MNKEDFSVGSIVMLATDQPYADAHGVYGRERGSVTYVSSDDYVVFKCERNGAEFWVACKDLIPCGEAS